MTLCIEDKKGITVSLSVGLSAGWLKADKCVDDIASYCITQALEEAGGVGTEERWPAPESSSFHDICVNCAFLHYRFPLSSIF